MTDPVVCEKNGRIAALRLPRPAKYDTLRNDMVDGLCSALEDANLDNEIRVIVLEGAGDSFCGGFDFSDGLEHFENATEDGSTTRAGTHSASRTTMGAIFRHSWD